MTTTLLGFEQITVDDELDNGLVNEGLSGEEMVITIDTYGSRITLKSNGVIHTRKALMRMLRIFGKEE